MKRCPTCNQTFSDEGLSFCTNDGTALVETQPLPTQVRPTADVTPPRPTAPAAEQPTLYMSASYAPPPVQYSQPAPAQGWQPPQPVYASGGPQQTIAVVSLVLGIASITVGWCCYFGVLTGPVAIGMGIYSLVQIKNRPTEFGGKPFAIAGIVTGGLYFVGLIFIILLYGVAFLMQGLNR